MALTNKITGKDVRNARHNVFGHMSEKNFARLLSKETGQKISPMIVARFEAYGKKGAASPLKPTSAVSKFIFQHLSTASLPNSPSSISSSTEDLKGGLEENDSEDDIEPDRLIMNTERGLENLSDECKEKIDEIVQIYDQLGLFEAEGNTAIEKMNSIEKKLQRLESAQFSRGGSDDKSIDSQLAILRKRQVEIDDELREAYGELKNIVNGFGLTNSSKLTPQMLEKISAMKGQDLMIEAIAEALEI